VKNDLTSARERMAERTDVHRKRIDDVVSNTRRHLYEADSLSIDMETVRLGIETHEGFPANRVDQCGEPGGIRNRNGTD
jgi:hypothetical protein